MALGLTVSRIDIDQRSEIDYNSLKMEFETLYIIMPPPQ